ncbi:N-acetylmuramidase domain-containing protein [Zoogloea sp.]|uniref:N-acetylmuramidase domain-containing protein n=1 Tax=Zoogloea sp. TaxID=49181 RepID=UPI0035B33954
MKNTVLCTACDEEAARLKKQGFVVDGCTPIPGHPDMCELSYRDPGDESTTATSSNVKKTMATAVATPATHSADFSGRGSPLTQDGLRGAASSLGVNLPALWAVMTVETSGCGFLPDRRPKILFERHVFHKLTKGVFDAEAPDISNGKPRGYGKKDGAFQYERLNRAIALDRTAALQSASWGLGQVMGFNAGAAGYADVETMVSAMSQTEDAHVLAMAHFIEAHGLASNLKNEDWAGFASGYNGKGFEKHQYDQKLKTAFARYSVGPLPDLDVRAAQLFLSYGGYNPGTVDGWFGPSTQKAVMQFQKKSNLPVSGKLDDPTLLALSQIT